MQLSHPVLCIAATGLYLFSVEAQIFLPQTTNEAFATVTKLPTANDNITSHTLTKNSFSLSNLTTAAIVEYGDENITTPPTSLSSSSDLLTISMNTNSTVEGDATVIFSYVGLSPGALIGIIIAGGVFVIVMLVVIVLLGCRNNGNQDQTIKTRNNGDLTYPTKDNNKENGSLANTTHVEIELAQQRSAHHYNEHDKTQFSAKQKPYVCTYEATINVNMIYFMFGIFREFDCLLKFTHSPDHHLSALFIIHICM